MSEGEYRKEEGMALAAANRIHALNRARKIARSLALADPARECDADRVRDAGGPYLGPAAGSLFKGSEWEFTGRRKNSRYTANHAREIKVWRLIA